jgi:hypothetical protein
VAAHPGMRFSVDPWDPSYGVSLDADELGESPAEVVADVELPADEWRPLDPDPQASPPAVTLFVDGVRRVDAQAWVHDPDGPDACLALYASYAAGVMCCCAADGAHLVEPRVRRSIITTAPHAVDVATAAGRYAASIIEPRKDLAPAQTLSLKLQNLLADVEVEAAAAARATTGTGDDLLVVDGTLRGRENLPRAVGYIKTHHKAYLERRCNDVVALLGPHQRTPVFRLGTRWSRYSWYLRLPCPPGAPWAGVVRLECSAALTVADALTLARRSQVTLARYASAGYKDSRAPQNLYPIGGLERQLRRRLGDAGVLYRALRTAAGRPVEPAAPIGDLAARRRFDPAVAGLAG